MRGANHCALGGVVARLGTAKAPSNGRIKSRVPAKDLPKRLGPLWCSVIIISVSTRPRRKAQGGAGGMNTLYSFFLGVPP